MDKSFKNLLKSLNTEASRKKQKDYVKSSNTEFFRKKQEERRDKIIETVLKAPWTYVSLREQVDQGTLTLEQAQQVLKAWKKTIETQEAEDRAKNPAEVERILRTEKVASDCVYPSGYRVMRVVEQQDFLKEALDLYGEVPPSDQNLEENFRYRTLATDCQEAIAKGQIDGIFWIPPIYLTAKAARRHYPKETKGKADDEVALWYALRKLAETREATGLPPLNDYLADSSGPDRQRLHPRAALAHAKNELDSSLGLTFWPLQTGGARKGESPRRTLLDLKPIPGTSLHESPADLYLLVCQFLSHPERANHASSRPGLCMWVTGSQRSEKASEPFLFVPCWYWDESSLSVDDDGADEVDHVCGCVSIFLPE